MGNLGDWRSWDLEHLNFFKRYCILTATQQYQCASPKARRYLEDLLESDDKNGSGSKQNTLKIAEHLSSSTVMLLTIVYPHSLLVKRCAVVPEAHLSRNLCGLSKDKRNGRYSGKLHMKEEEPYMLQSTCEIDSSLPNCKDLWDVMNEVVHLLVEENVLCPDRQKESLDFFCTEEATSAKSMSAETIMPDYAIERH